MENGNPGNDGPPTTNTPVKSTLPASKIRAAQRQGVSEHFSASDPTLDLTRMPGFGPFFRADTEKPEIPILPYCPDSNNLLAGCYFRHLRLPWNRHKISELRSPGTSGLP